MSRLQHDMALPGSDREREVEEDDQVHEQEKFGGGEFALGLRAVNRR